MKTMLTRYHYYFVFLLVFLCVMLIGVGLYFFHVPIFPDFFQLKNDVKLYERLELIVSSLTALVGLYTSITIIAFEIFKQKSGFDFDRAFKINKSFKIYISYVVSVILFSMIASYWVPTNPNSINYKHVTLVYYSFGLFAIAIILLFPISFNLFSSLKPHKIARLEIDKITSENLVIYPNDSWNEDEIVELIEKDHLYIVREITIALIGSGELSKARMLIMLTTQKLNLLIIEGTNKNNTTNRLVSFYFDLIDYALSIPNNSSILKTIWLSVIRIYAYLAQNKHSAKYLKEFRTHFFDRFFNRLFEEKKEEVIFFGIDSVVKIIQENIIFNTADENQLISLDQYRREYDENFIERDYNKKDYVSDGTWDEMTRDFQRILSEVLHKSIKYERPNVFNHCTKQIQEMNYEFERSNIGKFKEVYILIGSYNSVIDYTYSAFKDQLFEESHEAENILPVLFNEMIEDKHLASRTILIRYCNFLINLAKKDRIDHWFVGGLDFGGITTTGDLGFFAKRCAIRYNEDQHFKNCLSDCINTFLRIKESLEINGNPEKYSVYMQTKFRLMEIVSYLKEYKADRKIISKLNKDIKTYIEKNSFA